MLYVCWLLVYFFFFFFFVRSCEQQISCCVPIPYVFKRLHCFFFFFVFVFASEHVHIQIRKVKIHCFLLTTGIRRKKILLLFSFLFVVVSSLNNRNFTLTLHLIFELKTWIRFTVANELLTSTQRRKDEEREKRTPKLNGTEWNQINFAVHVFVLVCVFLFCVVTKKTNCTMIAMIYSIIRTFNCRKTFFWKCFNFILDIFNSTTHCCRWQHFLLP